MAGRRAAGAGALRLTALIGVDVGSGRIKAGLVDAGGQLLALASRPTPLRPTADGGGSYDAAELVATTLDACREVAAVAGERGVRIAGVGVASMAEAGVPLDADGRALDEVIAWFDPRSAAQAANLRRDRAEAALFALTGVRAEPKVTLAKLMWLAEHRPSVIRRMARWAGVADLVAEALGAPGITAPSLACRTLAFDLAAGAWRDDLLALADVGADQMPAVGQPGAAHGTTTADGAARSGLPAGIPVTVAGHDHVVGALGAGAAARSGAVADSIGTAEVAMLTVEAPVLTEAARRAGFSTGLHAIPGRAYLLGALPASGGLLTWLRDQLGDPGEARPGSAVTVEPFLRGRVAPDPDPDATLEIRGLREADGPAELRAAALAAVARHMRSVIEALAAAAVVTPSEIVLYGGGVNVDAWPSVRAAVNPWPTSVAKAGEAVCIGAALLAACAAGLYPSVQAAAAALPPPRPVRR